VVFGTTPGGEPALSKDAVPDVYPLYYCLVPVQKLKATSINGGFASCVAEYRYVYVIRLFNYVFMCYLSTR